MKEVEGTITAEEALRHTYKLIFKQDLKENREWELFTEREGLMQMGRYHFQILWTLPFHAVFSLHSWRYCEIKVLAAEPRSQKRSGDEAFEMPPARKPRYFE